MPQVSDAEKQSTVDRNYPGTTGFAVDGDIRLLKINACGQYLVCNNKNMAEPH